MPLLVLVMPAWLFLLPMASAAERPFRLPGDVLPDNYTLRIVTHFDDDSFRFYGQMSVDVTVSRDTDEVRLHAKALHVDYRSVALTPLLDHQDPGGAGTAPEDTSEENNNIPAASDRAARQLHQDGHYVHAASEASFRGLDIADVSMDEAYEELLISAAAPLRAGSRYRLSMRFWGTLNTEDRGYYRGSYRHKNQTRWISSTVFEPNFARQAFPCFDEPHFKANFSIILGRHRQYSTRSNMPMEHSEPMEDQPGWFWDYYPSSPKMPTYLVAFMVHLLESRSSNYSVAERPVRVWAPPGRVQFSNFSLWLAPRILATLGSTLGVPAVLPKQDLVAVPGFRSEALENWGLVSFEERHLLLAPDAGQLARQSVGSVVAHELAHIWFGNLLTPSWWSDIWLSEGFATYYSAVAMDEAFPGWRVHETSAGNAYLLVTSVDASPLSLPLLHPADNPHKLTSVFSAISYYKGYCMLRMLNTTLGAKVFDDGIRRYVRDHLYGSVSSGDLWAALQEAVDNHATPREPSGTDGHFASSGNVLVVGDDEPEAPLVMVPLAAAPDRRDKEAPAPTSTPPSEDVTQGKQTTPEATRTGDDAEVDFDEASSLWLMRASRDVGQVPIALLVDGSESPNSVALRSDGESDAEDDDPSKETQDGSRETPNPYIGPSVEQAEDDEYVDADVNDKQAPVPGGAAKQEALHIEHAHGSVRLPAPLSDIMRTWLEQPGYPIITVHRNINTGAVLVNQRRYLSPNRPASAPAAAAPVGSSNSTWWVPLVFATGRASSSSASSIAGGGGPSLFWLPPTCGNVTLPVKVPRDSWLLLNVGLPGLFRVQYDPRTLQQLSQLPRAAWQAVPPLTRVQLMADALGLAREGRVRYPHAMQMAAHLRRETSPVVWKAALPQLQYLERQLRGRQEGIALKTWLLDLLRPHAASIGFSARPQDPPPQASLRQEVTALACLADYLVCSRKARRTLKQLMAGRQQELSGSLAKTMLCSAVRWSGPQEWRFLRSFTARLSGPSRQVAVAALGCTRDSETLRSLLAETVSPNSTLRASDVTTVLAATADNEIGADVTIKFIEEKAERLYHRLEDNPLRVDRMLREVSASLNTAKQLERLDSAIRHFRSLSSFRSPPSWSRDVVRENMRWAERNRADVGRWLRARLDEDEDFRHSGIVTSAQS